MPTSSEVKAALSAYRGVSRDGWYVGDRLIAADKLADTVEAFLQVLEKEMQ